MHALQEANEPGQPSFHPGEGGRRTLEERRRGLDRIGSALQRLQLGASNAALDERRDGGVRCRKRAAQIVLHAGEDLRDRVARMRHELIHPPCEGELTRQQRDADTSDRRHRRRKRRGRGLHVGPVREEAA